MPCISDYGPPVTTVRNAEAEELALVAPALCALLSALEKDGLKPLNFINYDESGINQEAIKLWWENHKKQDEARRAAEAEEARKNLEAINAFNKLTPDERSALGLPRYRLKLKGQK